MTDTKQATKKKPTRNRKPVKCKCVDLVNEQGKEQGWRLASEMQLNMEAGTLGLLSPLIRVEKIGGGKGKLPTLCCSHCPFCGKKISHD